VRSVGNREHPVRDLVFLARCAGLGTDAGALDLWKLVILAFSGILPAVEKYFHHRRPFTTYLPI